MSDENNNKNKIPIVALDPVSYKMMQDQLNNKEDNSEKSVGTLELIVKSLKQQEDERIRRMSFEVDPQANFSSFASLYRSKTGLTPDHIIKKITGPQGDEMVCQILQARSNHIASFGRPRSSRFSIGFEFQPLSDFVKPETPEGQDKLQETIKRVKEFLWNTGAGKLDDESYAPNLSQFLKMITRDGLSYGRFAVELIWAYDIETGKKKLHAFRAVDAGTIYKLIPQKESDQSTRIRAIELLENLNNEKIDINKYKRDEYKWVQVIESRPVQAFSDDELIVYNLYPVTNVEYNGYPLTPIDQALNAITTHINITIHNKLYFQNGRAARGMLVFKSDSIDESTIQKIRLQFHQSINSVQNSWRMPVFAVGSDDDVSWQSIDVSGRDAEFQYLMDNNARVILSAFQMSPEELPGYAHLARGTNTQALSESDNEWKLTAARDVGLRPLLYDIQDFLNTHILPKIDEEFSKTHQIVLAGLDHDSPEKEATRLQQDMPIHMTMNDVLQKVEKDKIRTELGGDFPLNPQFKQQVIDPYMTVGTILENFFNIKDASKDPRWNYVRDPYWIQYQQILIQKAQIAMQQQMMQQQMMQQQMLQQQAPSEPQQGEAAGSSGNLESIPINTEKTEAWLAQNYMLLDKAIKDNHDEISKQIIRRHKEITEAHMKKWAEDAKKAINNIDKILGSKDHEDH